MADAQLFVSQDEFTCSLCLDTLTDPVTIPCGHNFCLKCLTDCWDQSQECSCPQCRHTFTTRPELNRNTLLNEVIKKFKRPRLSSPPPQSYASFGDVECDFCTGKKFRAVKSCLTCPASYCQTHLQPHYEGDALKHHKLVDPDRNLKEKLCEKHQKKKKKVEENKKSFTALIRCIEKAHKKLTERIREQEKREMEKAEGVMEQLEKEIEDLKWREAELKDPVTHSQISSLVFFSLLSDFCPLTLDINTAHRVLRLSEGNKKVTREGTKTEYPDHPDRFDRYAQVLCKEALTGTRCYWEVECSGDWMVVGVAYKGLSRKRGGGECGLGNNDKSWCLLCFHSQYSVWHNNQKTVIIAPYSPRIGVYLDWPAGSLSFYSVSHTMTLLHRFNTSFTEPLYPGFYLDLHCSVTISHLTPCGH
uniref:Tripartite motif-containing protein 16-like n=1 Tax=Erpetoichthys calabaricus TaxID=27687 RepID=A0A8C4SZ58_ERPCA